MIRIELADELLASVVRRLDSSCDRIAIAGSVRRRVPEVGDVEVCVIPSVARLPEFRAAVNTWPKVRGDADGKYTRRKLGVAELDLWIFAPATWACLYVIRTGSKEFSQALVTFAPLVGCKFSEGRLLSRGVPVPLSEESDVFDTLGLPNLDPRDRTGRDAFLDMLTRKQRREFLELSGSTTPPASGTGPVQGSLF